MEKIPVIIDCDPGVDDMAALMLAFSAENLDVLAVTTVSGNAEVEKTTRNALDLLGYLGVGCPVAAGAARPLLAEPFRDGFHGADGRRGIRLPASSSLPAPQSAAETMWQAARGSGGRLHVVTLGPLTNLATLFLARPEAAALVSHVTMMGGARTGGTATACAEFNVYGDPEAAAVVFRAGVPVTMVGLDATFRSSLSRAEVAELTASGGRAARLLGELLRYDERVDRDPEHVTVHDALAVAALLDPAVIVTRECRVDVELRGEYTRGMTVTDLHGAGTRVALDADRGRFLALLRGMLAFYDAAR